MDWFFVLAIHYWMDSSAQKSRDEFRGQYTPLRANLTPLVAPLRAPAYRLLLPLRFTMPRISSHNGVPLL
jgi:hypothetical protein